MKSAALKLESFAPPAPARPAAPTAEDVERASHEGYERGLREGREASLEALACELRQVSDNLSLRENERREVTEGVLVSLRPVLNGLVDLLAPLWARGALASALEQEIARCLRTQPRAALAIRCPPDLEEDVRDCVARISGHAIAVEHAGPGEPAALHLDEGRITLEPERILAGCRAIIDELTTGH